MSGFADVGYQVGLISAARYQQVVDKYEAVKEEISSAFKGRHRGNR